MCVIKFNYILKLIHTAIAATIREGNGIWKEMNEVTKKKHTHTHRILFNYGNGKVYF